MEAFGACHRVTPSLSSHQQRAQGPQSQARVLGRSGYLLPNLRFAGLGVCVDVGAVCCKPVLIRAVSAPCMSALA